MRRLFLFLSLVSVLLCRAGESPYAVASIAPALLKNAHAVKRMDETRFSIMDVDATVMTRRYAITVLNENGDHYAWLEEYYDKLRQVKSIEGRLYDASGKLIKALKPKDISDLSAIDDNNLMDDHRKKQHHFYHKSYPYTVEYEMEIRCNNTMFFPQWQPQEGLGLSVVQSSLVISCDPSYEVRFRAFQYQGEPLLKTEKNKKLLQWEVKDLPALQPEFAAPLWRERVPTVYLAPTEFAIQGYKGNMRSWKDFGLFQLALNREKDVLPEALVQTVKEMTSGLDEAEKVRVLYRYLQKNTRYISIQLGLGGWQPFEAATVAKKGYGDCKALSNYMYSLLKAAGIRSHYVLVYAGDEAQQQLITDFPARQFNHAVLCVPINRDTLWLECTSQSVPAGYMGGFTGNRKALLIGEDGGHIVSTPRYTIRENLQECTIKATIQDDGSMQMKISTRYGGVRQDPRLFMIHQLSKDKVQQVLQEDLELSTYHVNHFNYKEEKGPQLQEELDVTVNGYATVTGKRIFLHPNIINRQGVKLDVDPSRTTDFVFAQGYRDLDHYEIQLPSGYTPESIPQDVNLNTRFGLYRSKVTVEGNRILYERSLDIHEGRFPVQDQAELVKFYTEIFKADRSKIVLVKNQ